LGHVQGCEPNEVPSGYLCWALDENFVKDPTLASAIREEIGKRYGLVREVVFHRPPLALVELVEAGYRALARKRHPDHGGTHDDMLALNEAIRAVRTWLDRVMPLTKLEDS
jgi:hypothetical protein